MAYRNYRQKRRETGHIRAGVFLLLAGAVWILHEEGLIIPDIFYNWHLLVVGVGLFIGFVRQFRGIFWLVITAIGAVGLVQDYYYPLHVQTFIWPCFIILAGLLLIFRRRRPYEEEWEAKWEQRKQQWHTKQGQWHETKRQWRREARKEWRDAARDIHDAARDWRDQRRSAHAEETVYSDEKVDIASSFGTFRKKIVSKNFKGGYIVTFMGSTEIDLQDADFFGTTRLDVTQIMGNTTITIPEQWEVRPDLNSVFADFKDWRSQPAMRNPEKVLVLTGKSVFGAIAVRSRVVVE